MKGGVAAILGAVRAQAGDRRRSSTSTGELSWRSSRGKRMWSGYARRDPCRRHRRHGDHHRAARTSTSWSPMRCDHVPAYRPGRPAHASQRREGVSALGQAGRAVPALEADEARRNAAETYLPDDRARFAVSDDRRDRSRVAPGRSTGSIAWSRNGRDGVKLDETAGGGVRGDRRRAHRGRLCGDDLPFPTIRRPSSISGARFGSARIPSIHPLPVGCGRLPCGLRPGSGAPGRSCTAPTCACS